MNKASLTGFLSDSARFFGERTAIIESDGNGISYTALDARVKQFAEFITRSGLKQGARVAVLQHKSIENVVVLLAISSCGATYIPIDPEMSAHRIQYLLRDADPDMLIADPKLFPSEIPCQFEICALVPGMNNTAITLFNSGATEENPPAYILYTSGSTGTPKGVCVSHPAAQHFVYWSMNTFGLQPGDRVASIAPFHFDLSVFDLYASLFAGCTLHLFTMQDVKNVRLMAQELSRQQISVVYATPSFFTALLLHGKPGKHSWSSLRCVLFAGELFPVQHLHALMDMWNHATFYNLYGPTETNVCTWTPIHRDNARTSPYPIGLPCADHQCEISPEGELFIGGPHVANEYLNQPELTQKRFFLREGTRWFKTGDLVETDSSGMLLYKGRIDRMIKRRGYRVEPAEIEKALLLHPDVQSCVVSGITGRDELPVIVAFIVCVKDHVPSIMTVKEFLLQYLPDYMLPDAVFPVSEVPLTSGGKVDYLALTKMFAERYIKE